MHEPILSWNTKKSLCNHLTEAAGKELMDLLERMAARIAELEQSKVDVTYIVPRPRQGSPLVSSLRSSQSLDETFS